MLTECNNKSADCLQSEMKDGKCKCQSSLTCCSPSSLFSLFCHCSACITIASHLLSRLIDRSCRASRCCSASGPTSAMGPDCYRGIGRKAVLSELRRICSDIVLNLSCFMTQCFFFNLFFCVCVVWRMFAFNIMSL